VSVAVRVVSAFASFGDELREEIPSGLDGGLWACCALTPTGCVVVFNEVGAGEIDDVGHFVLSVVVCLIADGRLTGVGA
jgi:hypothetical protein